MPITGWVLSLEGIVKQKIILSHRFYVYLSSDIAEFPNKESVNKDIS